jgi:hypothetical protein
MIAETLGIVRHGIATGGTLNTLVDSQLDLNTDEFNGGTIWITYGNNLGFYDPITDTSGSTITFTNTLVAAIVEGDEYAVANHDFSMNTLLNAINNAVTSKVINKMDESLVVDADVYEYNLPSGVKRLRRVEVARNEEAPYDWQGHYHWVEENGVLRFVEDAPGETLDGYKMRIWYVDYHAPITATNELSDQLNLEWVKWMAVLNAWRTYIQRSRRDNPIAVELFNEALQREGDLRPLMRLQPLMGYSSMIMRGSD